MSTTDNSKGKAGRRRPSEAPEVIGYDGSELDENGHALAVEGTAAVLTLHTAPTEPAEGSNRYSVTSLAELARQVDATPPPTYLLRGLMASDEYGVIGAEKKAGKSFLVTDLAANVAAGGKFLGHYQCDHPGPVLLFAGEGGRRKLVRRFRAIAAFYGFDLDDLPVHIHERAPKLSADEAKGRLGATVAEVAPVLTIIDPAYLALAGAKTSQVTEMGDLLERAQHACLDNGSALLFTHHWNKTGAGSGFDRLTGSGFAEWARVMGSAAVTSYKTDKLTSESTAIVKLELLGDEIAGSAITYRRRVWVDDTADMTSTMHYAVEVLDEDAGLDGAPDGLRPGQARVLNVLSGGGGWLDHVAIGDGLADLGHPLKKRTLLDYLAELETLGFVERDRPGHNRPDLFRAHTL